MSMTAGVHMYPKAIFAFFGENGGGGLTQKG